MCRRYSRILPYSLLLPSFLPSFFCVGIVGACDIDRAEILFIYYILLYAALPTYLPTYLPAGTHRYELSTSISYHIISYRNHQRKSIKPTATVV